MCILINNDAFFTYALSYFFLLIKENVWCLVRCLRKKDIISYLITRIILPRVNRSLRARSHNLSNVQELAETGEVSERRHNAACVIRANRSIGWKWNLRADYTCKRCTLVIFRRQISPSPSNGRNILPTVDSLLAPPFELRKNQFVFHNVAFRYAQCKNKLTLSNRFEVKNAQLSIQFFFFLLR